MKPNERNINDVLKHALPSAPRGQMEAALDRVHARLQSDSHPRLVEPRTSDSVRVRSWKPLVRVAAAAAVVVAAVWGATTFKDQGVYAVLEAADGSMYRIAGGNHVLIRVGDRIAAQETVRSDGPAGAVLALADGSRVEMRSMSELSWDHASDGLKIRLDAGSIIVSAAKEAGGRLYVQTKDMTASVTGTTSLVNAAADGSRVASIEGQVEVREGKSETTLRPGQQVTTSTTLASRSLTEDTAWSRNADAYRRILESFNKGFAQTRGQLQPLNYAVSPAQGRAAAASPQFEEASIKPCDPDNVPPAPPGARGGGANSFYMSPGRTYALCMTLATIIRTAYGYGPADLDFLTGGQRGGGPSSFNAVYGLGVEDGGRVRGGPDWSRTQRYTIEAVADGAADAETMRGPMLRALLERRFQLKAHIETEDVPAYNLLVAPGGLKVKPAAPDSCVSYPVDPTVPRINGVPIGERRPTLADIRRGAKRVCGQFGERNGPNLVYVAGGGTFSGLAQQLAPRLGRVAVFDKTGVTESFDWILEFALEDGAPGLRAGAPPSPDTATDIPRGQTIFRALEEQLGLRLEPAKGQREFIVIDRVERPTSN